MCQIHQGQKLTHIVVNTKEIVCVYCAFDLVRRNPKCEVRELKEKFDEYCNIADKIININQNNVEIIQNSLRKIKENKKREEKKVIFYFEHILKYINTKKEEILSKINSIFTENATKLSQKLENFSIQIELGENLKEIINDYDKNNNYSYNDIFETYLKLESLNESEKNNKINLEEYKFIHDDENKMINLINSFGDIESISKYIPFEGDIKDIYVLNHDIFFDNINNNNTYKKQNLYKSNSPDDMNMNIDMKKKVNTNNNYFINNLMLHKNKSFVFTNKRNNDLHLLGDDMGNFMNTNNSLTNNNYIHTLNDNNISNNYSKFNLRINSNPKNFLNCEYLQRPNKNKNIHLNKKTTNNKNINYMNNSYKITSYKSYNNSKNTFKNKNNNYNCSKRTNS